MDTFLIKHEHMLVLIAKHASHKFVTLKYTVKHSALLRYVLDLVSQGRSGVSITPAVGQRTEVVRRHDASNYGKSFPRF